MLKGEFIEILNSMPASEDFPTTHNELYQLLPEIEPPKLRRSTWKLAQFGLITRMREGYQKPFRMRCTPLGDYVKELGLSWTEFLIFPSFLRRIPSPSSLHSITNAQLEVYRLGSSRYIRRITKNLADKKLIIREWRGKKYRMKLSKKGWGLLMLMG